MEFDPLCENISWASTGCAASMDRRGRDVVVVVARVAYQVSLQGAPRRVLAPIRRGDELDTAGGLRAPDDLAADEKPGTDVGLVGTAHPPRVAGQRSAYAWLSVGGLRKVITVHGPRVYGKTWRGVAPSDPAPLVDPVPLRYDLAYGGVDPVTLKREPTNPIGRGFASDPALLVGKPAPQLEPMAEGVTEPHPAHAAFAPIPPQWEPRRALAGTYDAAWARGRAPVRPRDFDPRHWCWSVPGLYSPTPLMGDEQVEVGGVLPEGVWRFRLPRYAVAFEASIEGRRAPYPTHLDGLFIDADARVVELTWRAAIPLPKKWDRLERIHVLGAGELSDEVLGVPRREVARAPSHEEAPLGVP